VGQLLLLMLTDYYRRWRINWAMGRRKPAAHAPYSLGLYRSIVQRAKRQGLAITQFDARPAVARESRIFFRHDIDFVECVNGAAVMLDINLQENIPGSVFLRVDGENYRPEDASELVNFYKAKGVLFGLHTSCYTDADYLTVLEREREIFLRTYGFEARAFTVHGLGELHLDRRLAFRAYASAHLSELGFDYSDCSADLRPYHRVFQDCDVDPANGKRAIYSDMETLPPLLRRGHNYLVLTHPCYWRR
jgi:hypothetical protein